MYVNILREKSFTGFMKTASLIWTICITDSGEYKTAYVKHPTANMKVFMHHIFKLCNHYTILPVHTHTYVAIQYYVSPISACDK